MLMYESAGRSDTGRKDEPSWGSAHASMSWRTASMESGLVLPSRANVLNCDTRSTFGPVSNGKEDGAGRSMGNTDLGAVPVSAVPPRASPVSRL